MGCRSQILALTPIIDSEPCIAALTPVRVPLLLLLPGDLSTNNWLWVIFAAGEGWHHNHHAFCYSARMGLEVSPATRKVQGCLLVEGSYFQGCRAVGCHIQHWTCWLGHHNHHAFCYSARMGFEVGLSGCWVHQSVGSLVLAFRCSVFRFWQWWWIPRGSAATSTCFVC
jgi:hypothetical protein